jgi:hypothetical protein
MRKATVPPPPPVEPELLPHAVMVAATSRALATAYPRARFELFTVHLLGVCEQRSFGRFLNRVNC